MTLEFVKKMSSFIVDNRQDLKTGKAFECQRAYFCNKKSLTLLPFLSPTRFSQKNDSALETTPTNICL